MNLEELKFSIGTKSNSFAKIFLYEVNKDPLSLYILFVFYSTKHTTWTFKSPLYGFPYFCKWGLPFPGYKPSCQLSCLSSSAILLVSSSFVGGFSQMNFFSFTSLIYPSPYPFFQASWNLLSGHYSSCLSTFLLSLLVRTYWSMCFKSSLNKSFPSSNIFKSYSVHIRLLKPPITKTSCYVFPLSLSSTS